MGSPAVAASLHADRTDPDRTARVARPSSSACFARRARRYSCAETPARSGRRAKRPPPAVRVRSGFPHARCSRAGRLPGRARCRVFPVRQTARAPVVAAHAARPARHRRRPRSRPHGVPACAGSVALHWPWPHRTVRTAPATAHASRPRACPMRPDRRHTRRSDHRSVRAPAARQQALPRYRSAGSRRHLPLRRGARDGIGQRGVVGLAIGTLP